MQHYGAMEVEVSSWRDKRRVRSCLRHEELGLRTRAKILQPQDLANVNIGSSQHPKSTASPSRLCHCATTIRHPALLALFSSFTLFTPAAGTAFTKGSPRAFAKQAGFCIATCSYQSTRAYASKKKMPPKKAVKEEKLLLGRPGNNLKSGIVCTDMCVLRQAPVNGD